MAGKAWNASQNLKTYMLIKQDIFPMMNAQNKASRWAPCSVNLIYSHKAWETEHKMPICMGKRVYSTVNMYTIY